MASATATAEHTHPSLGKLRGVSLFDGRVTQFRAIKFANVPGRFRQSQLLESLSSDDFTQYGSVCPQTLFPDHNVSVFGAAVTEPVPVKFDEFECLNLTISVPTEFLSSGKKVPVLTWVHGGAFAAGIGANCARENGAPLVDLSLSLGKPVVVVQVQYRVNYFGFLFSKELVDYASQFGEPAGNYGIRDILTAFAWIKKFIGGFGGDGDEITAFGESAGAIAISAIAAADELPFEAPFKRAILESGIGAALGALPLQHHQPRFDFAVDTFAGHAQDKVAGLVDVPADVFRSSPEPGPAPGWYIAVDGTMFKEQLTVTKTCEKMNKCSWLDSFIAGDCKQEGFMFSPFIPTFGSNTKFVSHYLAHIWGPDTLSREPAILEAAGLSSVPQTGAVSAAEAAKLSDLMGSMMFHASIYALVKEAKGSKKAYYYHFDRRNIFPDHWLSGISHHALDLLYVFQTMTSSLIAAPTVQSEELIAREINTVKSIGTTWIEFVYGMEPWDSDLVGVLTDDGNGTWEVLTDEEDITRNGRMIPLWKAIIN